MKLKHEPIQNPPPGLEAELFQGRACLAKNPFENHGSREIHIPHRHTAEFIPTLVESIRDHLTHHAGCRTCVILVECLTPSQALLSKETVGSVLTAFASGEREQAVLLLDPFARSETCLVDLLYSSTYDPEKIPGENLLNHCLAAKEYTFLLADRIRVLREEDKNFVAGGQFKIVLIDVDSIEEREAVSAARQIPEESIRGMNSIINSVVNEQNQTTILRNAGILANRYIAANACLINPVRNQTMYEDIVSWAEKLKTDQEMTLVALYGAAHIEIGLKRNIDLYPEGIEIRLLRAKDFYANQGAGTFCSNYYLSFSAALAADAPEDFARLSIGQRLRYFESKISEESTSRFLFFHALNQISWVFVDNEAMPVSQKTANASWMTSMTTIDRLLHDSVINAAKCGTSHIAAFETLLDDPNADQEIVAVRKSLGRNSREELYNIEIDLALYHF